MDRHRFTWKRQFLSLQPGKCQMEAIKWDGQIRSEGTCITTVMCYMISTAHQGLSNKRRSVIKTGGRKNSSKFICSSFYPSSYLSFTPNGTFLKGKCMKGKCMKMLMLNFTYFVFFGLLIIQLKAFPYICLKHAEKWIVATFLSCQNF